jgi:hypothetical protein
MIMGRAAPGVRGATYPIRSGRAYSSDDAAQMLIPPSAA